MKALKCKSLGGILRCRLTNALSRQLALLAEPKNPLGSTMSTSSGFFVHTMKHCYATALLLLNPRRACARVTVVASYCCSAQSWSGCSVVLVYLFYLVYLVYLENYLFNSSHVYFYFFCACVSLLGLMT